ncbi:cupin domain-containing protein [Streptomyces sp. NPDC007346]|uniref:cupin domain-containing protein n=1 Tax=Streptomyces sp. NPDC007346 TaxID=3154682 RepID=UPI003453F338
MFGRREPAAQVRAEPPKAIIFHSPREAAFRLSEIFHSRWQAGGEGGIQGEEDPCAVLHYMLNNECFVDFQDDSPPIHLSAGDLAVFRHGTAHIFACRPDAVGAQPLRSVLPERVPDSLILFRAGGRRRLSASSLGGSAPPGCASHPPGPFRSWGRQGSGGYLS